MLLYKTTGLSYKLLRSRIVDLTFRFFFLNANFMTCGLGLALRLALGLVDFFSELGLVLGLELGLVKIFFAKLGFVLGLCNTNQLKYRTRMLFQLFKLINRNKTTDCSK